MSSTTNKIKFFFRRLFKKRTWNDCYNRGDAPWDTGVHSTELERVLKKYKLTLETAGTALELGCGSGTNSLYLNKVGFKVTGVDVSSVAIDKANDKIIGLINKKTNRKPLSNTKSKKGKSNGGKETMVAGPNDIQFRVQSLPGFESDEKFNFIFDRGCFHTFKPRQRKAYAKMVRRLLATDGHYLVLTGNAKKRRSPGPPVLAESELRKTFEDDFEIIHLEDFHFGVIDKEGALGYSTLMQPR